MTWRDDSPTDYLSEANRAQRKALSKNSPNPTPKWSIVAWVIIVLAVVVGGWAWTNAQDKEHKKQERHEAQLTAEAYANGRVDQCDVDMALVDDVLSYMRSVRSDADLGMLKDLKSAIRDWTGEYYSQTSAGIQDSYEPLPGDL